MHLHFTLWAGVLLIRICFFLFAFASFCILYLLVVFCILNFDNFNSPECIICMLLYGPTSFWSEFLYFVFQKLQFTSVDLHVALWAGILLIGIVFSSEFSVRPSIPDLFMGRGTAAKGKYFWQFCRIVLSTSATRLQLEIVGFRERFPSRMSQKVTNRCIRIKKSWYGSKTDLFGSRMVDTGWIRHSYSRPNREVVGGGANL